MPAWMTNDAFLIAATVLSILMFLGSLAAIPIVAVRLPADYFVSPMPKRRGWVIAVRTAGAVILIGAGVAMLVLPGQGMLTILVGVSLLDFPAKRRMERRILRNRAILRGLNRVRRARGKEPFIAP